MADKSRCFDGDKDIEKSEVIKAEFDLNNDIAVAWFARLIRDGCRVQEFHTVHGQTSIINVRLSRIVK